MAKHGDKTKKRLTIMVSSTVYGIEELLEQVYALLNGFGYEVWCSHKGTVQVYPNQTALDSCLTAVEKCDLFLCFITPQYGSGVIPGQLGFTHQELLKAIELNKPRWILAHNHVPFARSLFMKLGCRTAKDRKTLLDKLGYTTEKHLKDLKKREQAVIDDFRVIDMYDAAIRRDLKTYQDRTGNWVQKFTSDQDAKLFATAQFGRYAEVVEFLRNYFEKPDALSEEIKRRSVP
ncbi:MAG: DUF4062 domain-containing protein [Pseudomonadota bacterium]